MDNRPSKVDVLGYICHRPQHFESRLHCDYVSGYKALLYSVINEYLILLFILDLLTKIDLPIYSYIVNF
jgi:hypothetical protein